MIVWFLFERNEVVQLLALIFVQFTLYLCERFYPANIGWHQSRNEKVTIVGITVFDIVFFGFITALYSKALNNFFTGIRESVGIDFWPMNWPIMAQVLLLFFAAEFVFYWVHRFIHESRFLWKVSAHGFHHSFKNLHAINFLTAHPFESFFVVFPVAFVSLLCGVPPEIIVGAGILGIVNSSIAHANIDTNSKVIGWVFTTSSQHRRHHSMHLDESNSNYSCKVILYDRLFGTYSGAENVEQTGISEKEPSLIEKLLLPIKEPDDSYAGESR